MDSGDLLVRRRGPHTTAQCHWAWASPLTLFKYTYTYDDDMIRHMIRNQVQIVTTLCNCVALFILTKII